MRTRCPACSTVFRVTPEQLRLKAGMVRCGHCHGVFDANTALIDDIPDELPPVSPTIPVATPFLPSAPAPQPEAAPDSGFQAIPAIEPPPMSEMPAVAAEPLPESAMTAPEAAAIPEPAALEAATREAREAGLFAARELSETPAYNRWAAGTLAGGGHGLALESPGLPRWPFVFMAILLLLLLIAQGFHAFRTTVVQRFPETAELYRALAIDVPLPRQVDLVAIEASDLQADNARGMLVLQATLRNRAAFDQAWPVLELTLTDAQDAVISRRVLAADDYLPGTADPSRFVARGEIGLRLWLEAKGIEAAGYRLYVFYP